MEEINRLRSVLREREFEINQLTETTVRLAKELVQANEEKHLWVRAFPFFITHHPLNFIEEIWGFDPHICNHFQEKHKGFCLKDGYSSYDAMMKFFHALSRHHQETLCTYIVGWWNENRENYR